MFNKLPTLILTVYFYGTIASQLSECVAPADLFNYDHFELAPNAYFNIQHFLNTNLPSENQLKNSRYSFLGAGAYGRVVEIELKAKNKDLTFPTSLKIQEYESGKTTDIDNEIKYNRLLSWANPLSAPIFMGCAHDNSMRRIFINSELMSGEVESEEFDNLFRSTKQRIEQYNLMARALLDLHLMGYCHNDIKSENFMFKKIDGKPAISKLIDFGMVTASGIDKFRGSINWLAPERFISPHKTSRKSDNYALGLVFYTTKYGFAEEMEFTSKYEYSDTKTRKKRFTKRHTKIENTLITDRNSYDNLAQKRIDYIDALHKVIRGLVDIDINTRMSLPEAISIFEDVLRKYDENSDYLTENAATLFGKVYPTALVNYAQFKKPEPSSTITSNSSSSSGFSLARLFGCTGPKAKKPTQVAAQPIIQESINEGNETEFSYPDQQSRMTQDKFKGSYANLRPILIGQANLII